MEEFIILHQIPSQKNIAFSVQAVILDANLNFALLPNSTDYFTIIHLSGGKYQPLSPTLR